jgi:hypothetical protein
MGTTVVVLLYDLGAERLERKPTLQWCATSPCSATPDPPRITSRPINRSPRQYLVILETQPRAPRSSP